MVKAFDRADWFKPCTRINPALLGFGWGLVRQAGGRWCWRLADNPGFENLALCHPAKRTGPLIFMNGGIGPALCEGMVRDVLGDGHAAFLWI